MIRYAPLLLLVATPAAAAPFQETPSLDRAVAAFTGHGIGDPGGARAAVDARLKLAACPTVSLAWRSDAHDAVVISCLGPEWRIYVPVVPTGDPVASVAGPVSRPVAAPPVVRRGDPVTIEASQDGFSITREGVAMGDAPPGGRVAIRVEDAKAPVQAVAVESGRVTLPGWPG